jgi:hypothetical protein
MVGSKEEESFCWRVSCSSVRERARWRRVGVRKDVDEEEEEDVSVWS